MTQVFKEGDYVRNKRSGNIGIVMEEDLRTIGAPFIRVMVVKPEKNIKFIAYWNRVNLEPIKEI